MPPRGLPRTHTIPLKDRLLAKVEVVGEHWLWRGCCKKDGYGLIGVGSRTNGTKRNIGAHVASWIAHRGEVPAGHEVTHVCDIRNCVRPDHLVTRTHLDNIADMDTKGRRGRWPDSRTRSHRNNRHRDRDYRETL